jgi:2Fe-2S ferredoxin
MPIIVYTDAEGQERLIEANVGDTVMETAVRNGVPGIIGECGGTLSCATCHVFVSDADLAELPPRSDMEDEMLWATAVDRTENSRLSCQLRAVEGCDLHVTTPATQV